MTNNKICFMMLQHTYVLGAVVASCFQRLLEKHTTNCGPQIAGTCRNMPEPSGTIAIVHGV